MITKFKEVFHTCSPFGPFTPWTPGGPFNPGFPIGPILKENNTIQ